MGKVKIAFIGAGSMGQCAHLKNYSVLPDCEVVALAELRTELAKTVAVRYGVPRTYNNHKALLDAETPDALVAVQPFTHHGRLLPELLEAGIPVFIEKPLASSVETGEKILAAVKRSGTWLMVGYHKRSDPAVMLAAREIEKLKSGGELGRMRYVRITMPPGDWVSGGFYDLIKTDEPMPQLEPDPPPADITEAIYKRYVSFVNYYIHQVNLLRHLLGEPYELRYADPSGVLLAAVSSSGVACTIEMEPYKTSVDWHETALVCFEHGYIKVELPAPLAQNRPGRIEIFKNPPTGGEPPVTASPHLPPIHAMRQQAMNFISAVKGDTPPVCSAEEALEDLKTAREYIRLLTGD